MAGAGFATIKKRIKSINNTKKITNAMSLVATSKLRKSKEKLYVNSQFKKGFDEVIESIINGYEGNSIYFKGNGSKNKLYLIITSDLGLCGGYNVNVMLELNNQAKGDRENTKVLSIGQKGRNLLKKYRYETVAEYVEISAPPSSKDAKEITNKMLQLYRSGEVGEVYIIYTNFVSTVKRNVEVKNLLPLERSELSESNGIYIDTKNTDAEQMIKEIVPMYLQQVILNLLITSKASEESTRMEAMNGATKSANDLLDKLNLQYNRLRQSVITQEISEIVGGAESQK